MELQHLTYFIKTAELNNISRTADFFNITQPSLSKAISTLEQELGTKLFDRIGRRIQLNEHGMLFLKSVTSALRELEDGTLNIKRIAKTPIGHVKIGAFSATNIVADCFAAYAKDNPYVRFTVRTTDFRIFKEYMHSNSPSDFDLIFYNSDSRLDMHMERIPIIHEKYVAIMHQDHPLAKRESIALAELSNSPFVAYHRKEIDQTYQFCMEAGFAPNIAYETDNVSIKPELINVGAAVGLIPQICIEDYKKSYSSICFVPICNPQCTRTVYLGWKSDNYLTAAARSFKDFAVSFYRHKFGKVPEDR